MKIVLVSCSKKKSPDRGYAADVYSASPWFNLARGYAETIAPDTLHDNKWFILSGKWGLLHPYQALDPYQFPPLNAQNAKWRRVWARMVCTQLFWHVPRMEAWEARPGIEYIFIAGKHYRKPLATHLANYQCQVSLPLSGMGIGEQQAWLKQQVEEKHT